MSTPARIWFALNTVVVVVALVIQIPITAASTEGAFDTSAGRVANLLAFFTILTNLILAATCAVLATGAVPRSTLFRTLRLDAVLGIVVTGIVYHTVLAGIRELHGAEQVADQLFHTVSPILGLLGWLLFGPRRLIDRPVVLLSVIYPIAWLAFTLVRGALIDWYPYPFVDATALGYLQVTLNCVVVAILFLVLAAAAMGADRLLARPSRAAAPSTP